MKLIKKLWAAYKFCAKIEESKFNGRENDDKYDKDFAENWRYYAEKKDKILDIIIFLVLLYLSMFAFLVWIIGWPSLIVLALFGGKDIMDLLKKVIKYIWVEASKLESVLSEISTGAVDSDKETKSELVKLIKYAENNENTQQ